VFAWGARGADGRNSAFAHGRDAAFGALQFWGGAADVPWGPDGNTITSNTPAGQWTYVAYTYDNSAVVGTNTGLRAVYVNGALAHSESGSPANVVLDTFLYDVSDPYNREPNPFPIGRSLPFRVGAQNNTSASAAGPFATMTIAKIRAYNDVLSAAKIAATYNAERVQFPGQPRITNVRVNPANGFVSFDWTPAPGRTYAVDANTDLTNPGGWAEVAGGLSSGSYTNNPGGAPSTHYRLRVEPLP
jgi:hypothetical protein